MNHPLDWKIDYCLTQIEKQIARTEDIRKKLYGIPRPEVTFEESWELREALAEINSQVIILRYDIKKLENNPPKKNFIKKLMRK